MPVPHGALLTGLEREAPPLFRLEQIFSHACDYNRRHP